MDFAPKKETCSLKYIVLHNKECEDIFRMGGHFGWSSQLQILVFTVRFKLGLGTGI